MYSEQFADYLQQLKTDFVKLAKIEFLNPDGRVAYALDNQVQNKRAKAFMQSGELNVNLQNGRRRQASIYLANLNNEYEFALNKIWYGQEIRLSEGLLLSDGIEFYIPQGVFLIENPNEVFEPNRKEVTFQLADKWANLDGTLGGNLEGAYGVNAGTNILAAISSLLLLDKYSMASNGQNPIDPIAPLLTNYYNNKTQTLNNGNVASLIEAPYDYLSNEESNIGEVILGLAQMIAAWVGYNPNGRLVIDPSQDDILDVSKPVLWDFSTNEKQLLSMHITPKPTEVFNDIIVVGNTNDNYYTARGRSQNRDINSDTCISRIGLKTKRISMSDYYSNDMCIAYAEWQLKKSAVLNKTITLSTTQMFHVVENQIIRLRREDKPGSPIERHLVQGFTRPIAQSGPMTINAVSVNDFPIATNIVESDAYMVVGDTLYVPKEVNSSVANDTITLPGSVSDDTLVLQNP